MSKEAKWYVAHTYSGYENKVKADIEKTIETIITKNTPISNGYYIHMFKISGDLRKAYAVIVVATNKGIRYVIVDGKAI